MGVPTPEVYREPLFRLGVGLWHVEYQISPHALFAALMVSKIMQPLAFHVIFGKYLEESNLI